MKYYVTADVHGFYTELETALKEKGFFDDTEPHKLIICGDAFDRGKKAVRMQDFLVDLLEKDELIYVRGNHEDLYVDMINEIERYGPEGLSLHHISNKTYETALKLADMTSSQVWRDTDKFIRKTRNTAFWKKLLLSTVNYYETDHYIFVHGWLPCTYIRDDYGEIYNYKYNPDWRSATDKEWRESRWLNGMAMAEHYNVIEPNKVVVCGHWHTSYGHCTIEGKGTQFGDDADFSPYYNKGIIALDGCTAHSGVVNVIVIEDGELDCNTN